MICFDELVCICCVRCCIPTYSWRLKSRISADFSQKSLRKIDPSGAKNDFILIESAPEIQIVRSAIKKSRFWQSLSFQIQNYVQKNNLRTIPKSVAINRPQSTSPQTLLKPFKIKDLSLLTHLYMKSALRRCSWCNSQLLTPWFRRATKQKVFIPSPATPGKNRLRWFSTQRGD